jgi:hypothetical protein
MSEETEIVNWYWEGIANVATSRANPHFTECRIGGAQGGAKIELKAIDMWISARPAQVEWILDAMVKEHATAHLRASKLELEELQEAFSKTTQRLRETEAKLEEARKVPAPAAIDASVESKGVILLAAARVAEALATVRDRHKRALADIGVGVGDEMQGQYLGGLLALEEFEREFGATDIARAAVCIVQSIGAP